MDYEKAFDFANRASIANQLMTKGCGKCLTSAITKTLSKSVYHPKISNNRLGEGIVCARGNTRSKNVSKLVFFLFIGHGNSIQKHEI